MALDWKKHRIVVTGAAGFIGSYLLRELLRRGAVPGQILLVDDWKAFTRRRAFRDLPMADLRIVAPQNFLAQFETLAPGLVFHIGACSNTEENREGFMRASNTDYTKKLWSLCAEHRAPLLYASSAGTYGRGDLGFSDDDTTTRRLAPLSLYARSKQDIDLFVLTAAAAGQQPPFWAGFKFFNVYGPGEEHKLRQASMALHLAKQLRESGKMRLYKSFDPKFTDGGQERDFVFVADVAAVLLDFATGERLSGIYNVGTGRARSFNDLAKAVANAVGRPADIEYFEMPEALRAQFQNWTEADLTRLRAAGCRHEFLSLEDGVQRYFREWPFEEEPQK